MIGTYSMMALVFVFFLSWHRFFLRIQWSSHSTSHPSTAIAGPRVGHCSAPPGDRPPGAAHLHGHRPALGVQSRHSRCYSGPQTPRLLVMLSSPARTFPRAKNTSRRNGDRRASRPCTEGLQLRRFSKLFPQSLVKASAPLVEPMPDSLEASMWGTMESKK